jgi:hypothetical protein
LLVIDLRFNFKTKLKVAYRFYFHLKGEFF